MSDGGGVSRRRALLTLAAGAVSAGCGGGAGTGTGGGGPGSCFEPADGGSAPPYCLVEARVVRVPGAKALGVGQAALTNLDDNTAVIVARDELGYHALSAICTHICCLVALCREVDCASATSNPGACGTSEVVIGDATAVCPCHGSTFRLRDGEPLTGPAKKPLPAFVLRFEGEDALVDTSQPTAASTRV
ncbi:MAG: Rieske (2Fe-2S) protein [Minicystis sp.]